MIQAEDAGVDYIHLNISPHQSVECMYGWHWIKLSSALYYILNNEKLYREKRGKYLAVFAQSYKMYYDTCRQLLVLSDDNSLYVNLSLGGGIVIEYQRSHLVNTIISMRQLN